MEDIVTSALPALVGLVSFWLAWALQMHRNAALTLSAIRGPQGAAVDGGSGISAQAIAAGVIRVSARRRPVERWLARVQRRAPAPNAAAGEANACITSPFARLAFAL